MNARPFWPRVRARARRTHVGLMRRLRPLPEVAPEQVVPADVAAPAPILDDICLPPYYGPADVDDCSFLLRLVADRRPSVVIEFGTAHGNMTANICLAAPEAHVFTVNALPEQQSGVFVSFQLSRDEIGRVYRRHGFASHVVQLYSNTLNLDLSQHLLGASVDLAIIDACHDAAYVLNDFHKVVPFVKPDGIVLLHDTHPSLHDHLLESYDACLRLRRRGFDIRHVRGTWWAVYSPAGYYGAATEPRPARAMVESTHSG